MARIVIEDAVLYIMAFYLVCSVLFSFALLDTYTPGQRYNSTTASFEPYTKLQTSILGDTTDFNDTMNKYNNLTVVDPGAMLNPIAVVGLIGAYLGLLVDMISSTMIFYVLKMFMGEPLARIITFILNVMVFIVGIRVITGRIRWD